MGLTIALSNETDGPGGAEVLLVQLAEELIARGHEVVPVLPVEKHGWLHGHFREKGVEPETVRLLGNSVQGSVAELADVFHRRGVDVVHSHEFSMSVFGAAAAGELRLPHVVTMHGNQWMTSAARRRFLLRWAFRHSRAVAAVSEDTRSHLLEALGVPPSAIVTVPNGIPERPGNPVGPRAEFGLAPNDLLLLAVGGLHPRKGHGVLIRSLARLRDSGLAVPWKLVIAGRGPEHENLVELAGQTGLSGQVILAGQREDIPDLQAAADIFVMPSLWEGLPLAILEAMFASNPVVASRTSGIPEAINDGEEGILAAPGDEMELADALGRLMTDAGLRARLGQSARRRALRDFTVARMAADYEALYGL
jgi:glycosyltransferase involved in cell wall biosynthesis